MIQPNRIILGNCEEVLKTFPDNSFDSCVTDPPYGISFMNKHWDYVLPPVSTWKEVLRVLKPGAHILVACGTRTQHRMAVNIEDAGFEIREVITWHYGSGFPKSLDISKAIDKATGAEREIVRTPITAKSTAGKGTSNELDERPWLTKARELGYNESAGPEPITDAAKEYEGWGTALKPATEFWTLARKPISENTIAENVLKHGTGGLNIDGSRIGTDDNTGRINGKTAIWGADMNSEIGGGNIQGRFPANVIFDEFTGKVLDEQTGELPGPWGKDGNGKLKGETSSFFGIGGVNSQNEFRGQETGGASRFFYCPKADNYERNKGLSGFEFRDPVYGKNMSSSDKGTISNSVNPIKNFHPTVKPIDLMRYLVKLITPKRGLCLDPFAGSGTTCIGAKMEIINYVGIEMVEQYCKIAEARVAAWNPPKYIEQTLF